MAEAFKRKKKLKWKRMPLSEMATLGQTSNNFGQTLTTTGLPLRWV